MIKQILAAVSFLTLVPVTSGLSLSAKEIGKSARWFPLVGALIGCICVIVLRVFSPVFPSLVVAVIVLIAEALLTGALHLDGLADMADGFGGGRTREDVLRIMRDHAIGAYGAMALILLVVLKIASIAALIDRQRADPYLVVAPVLGRWSGVFLAILLPYARRTEREGMPYSGAVSDFVGRRELFVATATALLLTMILPVWPGIGSWVVAVSVSLLMARLCRSAIGGVTGDTLGASAELTEVGVLLAGLAAKPWSF
ncbi:MAG TPA: adenosylcobinamide-GDP ribazoletransferase [Anaerolineales bacterium]